MAEFSGFVASGLRFGQNFTQCHWGCGREVVAMVGKLNANSDGQHKENQQDIKGKLEHPPISEHAKHIEVQGDESHR